MTARFVSAGQSNSTERSVHYLLALGMVLTGALQGAGDTMRPTVITFLTMWIFRMPLAYWLIFTCRLQTHGAWYAMMVTTIIGGLMTAGLFHSGKWKRIKV